MPDAPTTDGLRLVPLTTAALEALLDGRGDAVVAALGAPAPEGWPDEHDTAFLRLRLADLRRDPARAPWLVRALVRHGELVGHAGFHGPPGVNALAAADAVEIGYTVFPAYRGRGYARAAAAALVSYARSAGVPRVLASIAPDNAPSLAIVRRLGFAQVGEVEDEEDGLELVFELRT